MSFVVITCGEHDEVEQRIEEVGTLAELVVVDDSTEPYMYASHVVRDTHDGKRGAVRCLNIGMRLASNEIVVPMGADVHIPEPREFVRRLVEYFEFWEPSIVGFNVIDAYNHIRPHRVVALGMWLLFGQAFPERGTEPKYGKGISVVAFAIDRTKLGKEFDERFTGTGFNGEFDYLYGEKVLYAPDLRLYHKVPDCTYSEVVRRNRPLMVHNRGYFLKKYFRLWKLRLLMYQAYLLSVPLGEWYYGRTRGRSRTPRSAPLEVPATIPA